MRRRLVTFCSAISLLLFVAVCGLWVRSYWVESRVEHGMTDPEFYKRATAWRVSSKSGGAEATIFWERDVSRHGKRADWSVAGFHWVRAASIPYDTETTFVQFDFLRVPYWFLVGLTALAPLKGIGLLYRNSRRRLPGTCPFCGYDLRATPERCPECGREAAGLYNRTSPQRLRLERTK